MLNLLFGEEERSNYNFKFSKTKVQNEGLTSTNLIIEGNQTSSACFRKTQVANDVVKNKISFKA